MRIYVLRHGESLSNAAPDTLALPEVEGDRLSPRGEGQARAAAERIAELDIARIVSSPLIRAQQTAEPIAKLTGLEIETWDWIHELQEPSGYAELSRPDQEKRRWSNRMSQNPDDSDFSVGGGESFNDLLGRVVRTRDRLVADDVDRTLLVGHGIFCRFMFARTLFGDEFGPPHADWLWRIGSLNCGLSTFDHVAGAGSADPADISGWRCVTWMAPTAGSELTTGTGGAGPGA